MDKIVSYNSNMNGMVRFMYACYIYVILICNHDETEIKIIYICKCIDTLIKYIYIEID